MPRKNVFVFFDTPHTYRGSATQKFLNNEYFSKTMDQIDEFCAENPECDKQKLIDKLISLVGCPVQLNWFEKLISAIP